MEHIYNQNDYKNRKSNRHLCIMGNVYVSNYDKIEPNDIETWDVSKCKNMDCMFSTYRRHLDLRKWDISSCKDFNCMFVGNAPEYVKKWNAPKDIECNSAMMQIAFF